MERKSSTKAASQEKQEPFNNKRRLLSYWKSLESPTTPDKEDDTGSAKNELLEEFKMSFKEMDDCFSDVINTEKKIDQLRDEQLSIFKELGDYVHHFVKEKSDLDLNDNLKTEKDGAGKKSGRDSLAVSKENENLIRELEKQNEDHKSANEEQQRDIEKLTREVQTLNISRRKLERELLQAKKLKEENEVTINSLRRELQTVKETYENEVKRLSSINEQVSRDNSELVEKGKEVTESLKVALQQLTDEKKAMQEERRSISGKDTKELEMSLERVKKEREAFRQRCEKSEMLQRNLQQEITTLRNKLIEKEDEIKTRKEELSATEKYIHTKKSNDVSEDDSAPAQSALKSAQSRISQLKNYVHVLEDRVKEKEECILALRNENARANDVAMEKSLELSRTRRLLEKKIEKLMKENSEWKTKFLIPSNYGRTVGMEPVSEQIRGPEAQVEKTDQEKELRVENNVASNGVTQQKQKEPSDATSNHASPINSAQSSGEKPVEVRALDVTPKRRMGRKFNRATSQRHSADLGKLMSRHTTGLVGGRKSESNLLDGDEPATIFVNKYRRSGEEHWV